MTTNKSIALVSVMTLGLLGCGSSSDSESRLSIALTDAPIDNATTVVVEFEGIELKPKQGPSITYLLDAARQINLLDFQGENSTALFDGLTIASGEYNWMRLMVNAEQQTIDSYITFEDGSQHSLYIPSGGESGLKWNQGFIAPANGDVDFTIDFDLRQSVHRPSSQGADYFLRPVIRVLDSLSVGHIQGTVSAGLMTDDSCTEGTAVYLFAEEQAVPDDMGSDAPPQATASVNSQSDSSGTFTLGFVLPGNYQLAFTCQADLDDPELNDTVEFASVLAVTVTANNTTQVAF